MKKKVFKSGRVTYTAIGSYKKVCKRFIVFLIITDFYSLGTLGARIQKFVY
jgi:hypothetical protein